jgi:hypothetical protein
VDSATISRDASITTTTQIGSLGHLDLLPLPRRPPWNDLNIRDKNADAV